MPLYESKYKELSFYCCDKLRTFSNGRYSTEDEKEIEVLEKISDAVRVEEAEKPKAEEPKATPKPRKSSAK